MAAIEMLDRAVVMACKDAVQSKRRIQEWAMGIPTNMFTVCFAIGRLPGCIAPWKEQYEDPNTRITRPRQIYVGPTESEYVPLDQR